MTLQDALQIENPHMIGEYTCTATMHVNSFHSQPQGYLNGGATIAFAEILGGMMSNELIDPHQFGVGQSVTANHVRPMKCPGTLTAQGTLLLRGNTSHVWRFDMMDGDERLISQVTVTIAIVRRDR